MKENVLVVIKPDAVSKGLIGNVLEKFPAENVEIVAARVLQVPEALAQEHYRHIKNKPFFKQTVDYLLGKYTKKKVVLAIVLSGENAIKKCRDLAGSTNPEEADPTSIRGSFGRITTRGVFENVLHVSSDPKEAEREIKLWFDPNDIAAKLYPTKVKTVKASQKRVWA